MVLLCESYPMLLILLKKQQFLRLKSHKNVELPSKLTKTAVIFFAYPHLLPTDNAAKQ